MKRNHEIKIHFTKDELDQLTKKVRKTNLSREAYCRRILNDSTVKEAPNVDVPVLIREVRQVGSNINQLLKRANTSGFIDAPELRKALKQIHETEKRIRTAYAVKEE